jgi:hypothetical protein
VRGPRVVTFAARERAERRAYAGRGLFIKVIRSFAPVIVFGIKRIIWISGRLAYKITSFIHEDL